MRARLVLAVAAVLLVAAAAARAGSLEERLDAIFGAPALRDAEVGVAVVDLETGRTVYERDAARPLIPASNQKLATTACALDRLGPDYRLETLLLRAGPIEGDVLRGPLVARGGGDPCIGARFDGEADAVLRRFARAAREAGIRRVAGDIVADDRLFDRDLRHPGWPRDQLDRWYAAPVCALSLNEACVDVTVSPGPRPGVPVAVALSPAAALFEVEVRATTTGAKREHVISVERRAGTDRYLVRGAALVGAAPVTTSVPVEDPALVFAAVLRDRLIAEGITVEGRARRIEEADAAREAVPVAGHASLLQQSLAVVNKRSQNHHAEMLLKLLGARTPGGPGQGSFAGGAAVVAGFLAEIGAGADAIRVDDGSGLSRGNRIAARDVARLLVHMARHRHADAFIHSLAVAGAEGGTLERRLRDPAAAGRVHAKTGTINGVSALSGYVFARGRPGGAQRAGFAFSILANGLRRGAGPAREAQDACVLALLHALDGAERGAERAAR